MCVRLCATETSLYSAYVDLSVCDNDTQSQFALLFRLRETAASKRNMSMLYSLIHNFSCAQRTSNHRLLPYVYEYMFEWLLSLNWLVV